MKLNVLERLKLLQIVPSENNFITLKVVRGFLEKLGLTEDEFKEFDIKTDPQTGSTTWNDKGNEGKEFSIGEKETDMIVEALKELDKQKKLTQAHITLYEKFVEAK